MILATTHSWACGPSATFLLMVDPDAARERSARAVLGRKGCRATTDIHERYTLFSYVLWHQNASQAQQHIELVEACYPGAVSSYMHQVYAVEFQNEANGVRAPHGPRRWTIWSLSPTYERRFQF